MTTPAPDNPDSPYTIHDYLAIGAVPSLDAALDAYAWRLGTPATPLIPANPGDPLAVPPIPATPEVPAVDATKGTLGVHDEIGVAIKTAAQEQGYAQRTILKAVFALGAVDMTPLPPLPAVPAADGSAAPAAAAAPPTFESIP